jgi:hypothetical protein
MKHLAIDSGRDRYCFRIPAASLRVRGTLHGGIIEGLAPQTPLWSLQPSPRSISTNNDCYDQGVPSMGLVGGRDF